jgi:GNAT superfamily N-acetyltransferase
VDQPVAIESEFIRSRTAVVVLDDGGEIVVRPIVASDRHDLAEGLAEMSDEDRHARFFRPVERLTDRELTYLTEIDYHDHFAWVATTSEDPPAGVGVARYIRLPDEPEVAEAAVVVLDAYQRRGIATVLLELLARSALDNGVTHFRAYSLPSNRTVIDALSRGGAAIGYDEDDAVVSFDLPLPLDTGLVSSPMYAVLRDAAAGAAGI